MKYVLEQKFSKDQIQIIGRKVPGAIGVFEVEIENVKLLHSKKNGQGFVDNTEKINNIVLGIQEKLWKDCHNDNLFNKCWYWINLMVCW